MNSAVSSPPSPAAAPPRPNRLLRNVGIGALLALVLYAGFAVWADFGGVKRSLATFPLQLLPIAMGLSFANYLVRFLRWERYRKLLAIELDLATSFTIHLAGLALTVSPGKMGEAFKSWLVRRVAGTPIAVSAPIVVAERFTDLLAFLVLIAIGGIATAPESAWVFWATFGMSGVLAAFATSQRLQRFALGLAAKLPVVARFTPKIEEALVSTRVLLAPRQLCVPTLLATIGWGLECTAFWLVASAFVEGGVPYLFAVYTFALSAVAGAVLILFPGGLGVTEASMGGLLRARYLASGLASDVASASAVSATLLIRLCTLWFAVGVGVIATLIFKRRYGSFPE